MRIALATAALTLSLVTAPSLADPGKDESGRSREQAARYYEAEREFWKRQEERAREERKRREEHAREQRKREEEWLREERKRAREWEREHGYEYEYEHFSYPVYVPYVVAPAYPPEGITITRDGIEVWLGLQARPFVCILLCMS